jgi:hypothetical protein
LNEVKHDRFALEHNHAILVLQRLHQGRVHGVEASLRHRQTRHKIAVVHIVTLWIGCASRLVAIVIVTSHDIDIGIIILSLHWHLHRHLLRTDAIGITAEIWFSRACSSVTRRCISGLYNESTAYVNNKIFKLTERNLLLIMN